MNGSCSTATCRSKSWPSWRCGRRRRSPADPMRGLASSKRSTAPSNGMDAKRSAGVPLSSPAAAQRCAEGAGLDSGAPAAAQSAMPSIALPATAPTARSLSTNAPVPDGASASVSNFHQLDGRDLLPCSRRLDYCFMQPSEPSSLLTFRWRREVRAKPSLDPNSLRKIRLDLVEFWTFPLS